MSGLLAVPLVYWIRGGRSDRPAEPLPRTARPPPEPTFASPGVNAPVIVNAAGLRLQLYLLSPAAFGIDEWVVGDSAVYRYSGPSSERDGTPKKGPVAGSQVGFTVVREAHPEDAIVASGHGLAGNFWLRLEGWGSFRNKPFDMFAPVQREDLRPTRKALMYQFQAEYFPFPDWVLDMSTCEQARLTAVNEELVETPGGSILCRHFEASFGEEKADLWTSQEVRPLGIVRFVSAREELMLTSFAHGPTRVSVDATVQPLIEGQSTFFLGCLSCHRNPMDPHTVTLPPR